MNSQVHSKLIKDMKNGNSYCTVCLLQFKTKVLTAHINGKKHRESLLQMKDDTHIPLVKRKLSGSNESFSEFADNSTRKRSRNDQEVSNVAMTCQIDTDRRTLIENDNRRHLSGGTKLIEGLPLGFFDDNGLQNRVHESVEKQKQINSEMDRFYKEVEELDEQKDDEQNNIFELSTSANDIELIDEQIERWRTINELEKKKESVVEFVSTKSVHNSNFDPTSDTEPDFLNFDSIDWRTKNL